MIGRRLAFGLVGVAVLAAVLAGTLPVQFSIATVFLFAGPHNWIEARYFLGRLPARAGKLLPFFAASAIGIVLLTAAFAAMPLYAPSVSFPTAVAGWLTALILWVAALTEMRRKQNPRKEWGLLWPAAFGLIACAWSAPYLCSLGVVYLHPLMALWILDRELARSRPEWRPAYHKALLSLPLLLLALAWHLRDAPALSGDDVLTRAIANHAGADYMAGVPEHLLVSAHTFLEMVHYAVWLVAIPLIGIRGMPWTLNAIPAARRSRNWRRGVAILLICGLFVGLTLWVCFAVDYPTTRQVYFTVALLHVLAEVPFLLRAL